MDQPLRRFLIVCLLLEVLYIFDDKLLNDARRVIFFSINFVEELMHLLIFVLLIWIDVKNILSLFNYSFSSLRSR